MYEDTNTRRVGNFNDHFQMPDVLDIPGPEFEKHPEGISIELNDWIQCIEFPIIFSLKGNTSHFYCDHAHCKHWFCMSNTFGNAKSHIRSRHLIKKENIPELIENHSLNIDELKELTIPTEIDKLISSKFKSMILKTGKPFSLVCNDDMKSVLKHLGTRHDEFVYIFEVIHQPNPSTVIPPSDLNNKNLVRAL